MGAKKILFLGTYHPRECGIATFTRDLSDAISKKAGNGISPAIIAMNEDESIFRKYPKNVICTITEPNIESYDAAAEKINSMRGADVLSVQHEFGIFGGNYGSHLIRLMERTDKKIITTLHTVLENPEQGMRDVVRDIFAHSDTVVVMTENAKKILVEHYGVPGEKMKVILHGVPPVSFGSGEAIKKKYGLEGKKIILTFGLLSRGKGIENAIMAMPEIVKRHPDCIYVILGQTHPKVREESGEDYRNELKALVRKTGAGKHVKFWNKFLSIREITDFLQIATVYFATSLDQKQITSGTVSYALGAGKAIVASKTKYNEEILANGRGIIVADNSPKGFADGAIRLLSDNALRRGMEKNAFEFSRKMSWPNVSIQYLNALGELAPIETKSGLPRISFRHFSNMTDDFGMIQFADYTTPDIGSGYTLDDNARALMVAAKGYERFGTRRMLRFADTFINFIEKCGTPDGGFHNVLSGRREFMDEKGSEDSFGRAVWALGHAYGSGLPDEHRLRAKKILDDTLKHGIEIKSPRAQAHTLMGLAVAKAVPEKAPELMGGLIDSLVSRYESESDESWKWFEPYLTYNNSRIPEALFECHEYDRGGRAKEVAVESLSFLTDTVFINGKLVPIGQEKWYERGGERSLYDQQPLEASGMTAAYLAAFKKTGDKKYLKSARESFDWFLGKNSANMEVYDRASGGCFDGITRQGVNANEGAESTTAYLLARLSI
ncbi:MAG: glycosyltransferase family 4 protein [Candidatus Diapherotrites archaeon]